MRISCPAGLFQSNADIDPKPAEFRLFIPLCLSFRTYPNWWKRVCAERVSRRSEWTGLEGEGRVWTRLVSLVFTWRVAGVGAHFNREACLSTEYVGSIASRTESKRERERDRWRERERERLRKVEKDKKKRERKKGRSGGGEYNGRECERGSGVPKQKPKEQQNCRCRGVQSWRESTGDLG
jgi:hypothetical protein